MKEITGNIWDFHKQMYWIVVPTNGTVRKDGACAMGRGLALQAAKEFEYLAMALGKRITQTGNKVYPLWGFGIISFPVKRHWSEKADLSLINKSCGQLLSVADIVLDPNQYCLEDQETHEGKLDRIYMVQPGCGNGRLEWKDVKPILEKYLDDRFIVVQM